MLTLPFFTVEFFETPYHGGTDASPALSHQKRQPTMIQDSILEDSGDDNLRNPDFSDSSEAEEAEGTVDDSLASQSTVPDEEPDESYLLPSLGVPYHDNPDDSWISNNNNREASLTEETLRNIREKHSQARGAKKPLVISEENSSEESSRPGSSASYQ